MRLQVLQLRSSAILAMVFLVAANSACAQEKTKRMVPGPSAKELVPESPSEGEDGVSRIIFAQLFKEGSTEYTHVGTGALKNVPPLPTGYSLYKDRVYDVKTQAIITASFNITVFNVSSLQNEHEFKKLAVLHLKSDEMSPADKSWEEITLFTENVDERIFHYIPKAKYDSLQPDFKSKRIAGISDQFGIFAIAFAPESEPGERFPEVVLKTKSSPEPVQVGQEVTHTLTFTNKGVTSAAEVNIREVLDAELDYVSVVPSQGVCKQKRAANIVVCHLGVLPSGASAEIRLVARARKDSFGSADRLKEVRSDLEVIFKQQATDFVDERGQIFSHVTTTITKKDK
ncbi:MAG: DUF11 domain-containing protein [Pyrinomonadaceae bacterium]